MNAQYRKDKMRKQKINNDVVNNIDETIIETCKWIKEKLHTGTRESETIKALADLVKARYLIGHDYFLSDSSPKE